MTRGDWIGLGVAFVMLNTFALIIGSHAYTAWSIRTRNEMYYFLLKRPINRQRRDAADEIAEGVVRWLRLLSLTVCNGFWLWLFVHEWMKSRG